MAKTFDHAIIYNGTFYPTGAEVPVKEVKEELPKTETTKAVKVSDKSRNSKT